MSTHDILKGVLREFYLFETKPDALGVKVSTRDGKEQTQTRNRWQFDDLITSQHSLGFAHPTKAKFGFAVNGATMECDNLRVIKQNNSEYVALAEWCRNKFGRVVLGDGCVEADWTQKNRYVISDFAFSAHDGKLDILANIIRTT